VRFDKFHVVCVVSNPIRYKSRYNLYQVFQEDITRKGAQLWTVELQTGARTPRITEAGNPNHIQLWSSALDGVVWNKENLQNIAVQQLTIRCPDWRYVCFLDADVRLERGWLEETAHALQLHPVVQPWSHAIDFAPDGGAVSDRMQLSYAYCYVNNIESPSATKYTVGGHPGYALAMRREAYNHLGGLIDIAALGSGDRHMMAGLVGRVEKSYHPDVSQAYKTHLLKWQERADKYIKRNLGYVPMVVRHMFHGAKKNRQYGNRWKILTRWQYNPDTDLKRDTNGVYQLVVECPRQVGLRDAMYRYFRSRQEDSNSL
jgi:hypothetical protein